MGKDLNSEIRALMSQIGLEEGADEDQILSKFAGREPAYDPDMDDESGLLDDEEENISKKSKAKKEKKDNKTEAKAETAAGKEEKNSKADKKKAAANKAAPAATAATPASASSAAPISLSRPKPVKEEPAPRQSKKKVKEEEEENQKDELPLNNPSLNPSAAPPKTVSSKDASTLKWWKQAAHVTLVFPSAAKQAGSQGKKVKLTDSASASSLGFVLPATVEECYTLATERLAAVVSHFESVNQGKSSDARWLSTVMTSGTLSDKVAGMTLMIQEAPLYRLDILDKLLAMARKTGRRENSMAIDALKDLFLNDLLPPRKLLAFAQQPFFSNRQANPAPTETQLVYWLLEDQLKARYMDFLSILEEGTHDEMAYIKKQRLGQLYDLVLGSPERERVILALLVNKLGDVDRKVGSRVLYLLNELLKKHPGFKLVLVGEMEQLLYREHISKRAQYYAIIFLNQMVFVRGEEALANKMISVYFLLFKQFIQANQKEREEEMADAKKKLAKKRARLSRQAAEGKIKPEELAAKRLKLSASATNNANDALRSKLLGGLLSGINRALPYASSSVGDGTASTASGNQSGEELVLSQMDMIFNLVHTTSFNTSIQALMLLYQVLSKTIREQSGEEAKLTGNVARFYRALYEKLLSPDLISASSKHGLFLNLLFKSLKNDPNADRVAAFAKRLLQVSTQHQPPFICGVLYLLSEILQTQKGLYVLITQPQQKVKIVHTQKGVQVEDDEDEHFHDVTEEEEQQKLKVKQEEQKEAVKQEESTESAKFVPVREAYDPTKRDPQFAQARSSCLWELLLFHRHYHPSVVKFATDILSGVAIHYAGDPLKDFTPMHFLDRFVFKNPKKVQPNRKDEKKENVFTRPKSTAEYAYQPANTPAFLSKAATGAVAADQLFLAHYFQQKSSADRSKPKSPKLGDAEMQGTEEEEDAYADQIIEAEMRKVEPDGWMGDDGEDDEDIIPSDSDEEGQELDFEGDDAPMSEDEDEEAAAEAAALAEMEGGVAVEGEEDEEEEEQEFSDSDEDEEEFTFDDSDSGSDDGGDAQDAEESVFASAEEFADLLNSAGDSGVSVKQTAWEKRSSIDTRGGKGGKKSAGGYKSAPAPGSQKKQQKGKAGQPTPEKPSFKRKLAEAGVSRSKKGKKGGNKKARK